MAENGQVRKTKFIPEEERNIKRAAMTISSFLSVHGIDKGTVNLSDSDANTGKDSSTPSSILASKDDRKYMIGKLLAKGGMGAILSAKDLNIHRDVAMKVMLDATELTADNIVRFIEEARRRSPASSNIPASSRSTNSG